MPAWASTVRWEDVRPSFDVFAIGKVLYSMVSGKPVLPLWYWGRTPHKLSEMFPDTPETAHIDEILRQTVVQEEEDCSADANELLKQIQLAITVYELGSNAVALGEDMPCRFCGTGTYDLIIHNNDQTKLEKFGLRPHGDRRYRIYVCNNCGHTDLFYFPEPQTPPPAWT
jgi:hypothetical protein